MASFTDSKGDRWEVPVTVRQLVRVKQAVGVDLGAIAESRAPTEDLDALKGDLARMVDVLHVCCERQAQERGVSDAEFGERLGDLHVFGEALDAFTRGFVDFFLQGPAKARAQQMLDRRMALANRKVAQEQEKVLSALESFSSASDSPGSAG